MANGFACLNPRCSFVFPPTLAAQSKAVPCPRCGTLFPVQAIANAAWAPVPARPRKRKLRPWLRGAIILLCVPGTIGVVVAVGLWISRLNPPAGGPPSTAHESPSFNYRFTFPGGDWQLDDPMRAAMKWAHLVMRRRDAPVWLALGARDYKKRTPRPAEAVEEGLRRLRSSFAELEWSLEGEVPFAGRKAQRLIFQGDVQDAPVSGECYVLVHQGIAYWFATWAARGSAPNAHADFQAARKGFALLGERESWQEARPEVREFEGTKARFVLRDASGLWVEQEARDYDEKADLALLAFPRDERPPPEEDRDPDKELVGKSASVVALVLDPKDDLKAALAAARAYLDEKRKKQGFLQAKSEVLSEQPAVLGQTPARIATLLVESQGSTHRRFVLLAVLHVPGHILAVQCECSGEERARAKWEGEFRRLLAGFRLSEPPRDSPARPAGRPAE
jgi:hypothetical protein